MSDKLFFGNKSGDDILKIVSGFHSFPAPGVILGTVMVDYALLMLPAESEKDVIVETTHCLPDAVQLFTPCTYGNGWLKVVDWDRFALTIYDKHTLEGFRVWLDLEKLKNFKDIYNWYMRLVPKKSLPLEVLNPAILEAGAAICSGKKVKVTGLYGKKEKKNIEVCPQCGEPYVSTSGQVCPPCSGSGYFEYK